MFKKLWKWLKEWWENRKDVVLKWVIPKIYALEPYLADKLVEIEGTPQKQAEKIVDWVVDYLKRQL